MPPSMDRLPRVQMVSKPMVPPFRDGSKCLVRDLCLYLERVEPHVMGTGEPAVELGERTVSHSVYGSSGGFSPGLRQNLSAAFFLLTHTRADLWHFVFAPNPRSSQVGGVLKKLRNVPTIQTIASPPRNFENPGQLLFGDICIAQSEWTRTEFAASLNAAGVERRLEVVFPPAPDVLRPSEERCQKERARLGVKENEPLFVYPGDLEVSHGAALVVGWAREIAERVPGARVVVAYRDKTSRVEEAAQALRENADPKLVLFERNVPDIHALIATCTAVLFPVDDLYGKVDLPIVLLEAMRFGTPVLALDEGPLQSLWGALRLPLDSRAWFDAIARLVPGDAFRNGIVEDGKRALNEHFAPDLVAKKYEALYLDLLGQAE